MDWFRPRFGSSYVRRIEPDDMNQTLVEPGALYVGVGIIGGEHFCSSAGFPALMQTQLPSCLTPSSSGLHFHP